MLPEYHGGCTLSFGQRGARVMSEYSLRVGDTDKPLQIRGAREDECERFWTSPEIFKAGTLWSLQGEDAFVS